MNRFEKNILESEMGLDRASTIKEIEDADAPVDVSVEENEEMQAATEAFAPTDGGEQLKIDDALLGSDEEDDDKFFLYGYQDELDLSSLEETADAPDSDTDKDGSLLYKETVKLIESGEIELDDGIALLKKNAERYH